MIYLDFETRSRCIIQRTGAWRYAQDASTDVLCMAWAIDDGPVYLWKPGEPFPISSKAFYEHKFEAHNSSFERAIWKYVMVKKYKWPHIDDDRWECSAALACYYAMPRALEYLGAALNLKHKKDVYGKRTMMKLSRPRADYGNGIADMWNNSAADLELLYEYCKADVEAERDVHKHLAPLPPTEQVIWKLDQKINERGIRVDISAVINALNIVKEYQEILVKRFKELTGIESPTMVAKFKNWLVDNYVPIKELDKNSVISALSKALDPDVREALEIRQSLSKTSTAKYQAIVDAVGTDQRLRGLLLYHGAGTGRWSGQLIQPQNFPRNNFKGDLNRYFAFLKQADLETYQLCYPVMQTLSSTIRGVFIPSEGHTFFGGDYNAIEARVLFWLANESRGLQMFREGQDIYKDMAATIYDCPVDKVTKEQRELGKRGILGAGYGMGSKKFKETCAAHARLDISLELAEKAITAYRTKYRTVAVLWQLQELAAKQAITTKKPIRCGKVVWEVHNKFLFCRLPSGRSLAYYDPEIRPVTTSWGEEKMSITHMGTNSVSKQWERQSTYGGKIVENISQAVARDLMAWAMVRCEKAGYKVLLSVHDELLTETEAGTIQELESLMVKLPEWAAGMPVKAEGWSGKRYLK